MTCVNDAPLLMNERYYYIVHVPYLNQGKKKVILDPIWFWILEVHCHLFTCIIICSSQSYSSYWLGKTSKVHNCIYYWLHAVKIHANKSKNPKFCSLIVITAFIYPGSSHLIWYGVWFVILDSKSYLRLKIMVIYVKPLTKGAHTLI